jgi:tRNA(fMet)-specific endonuclease VapC
VYIFDTDHFSLIQRNGQEGKRIVARFTAIAQAELLVTIATYEEQVRGRLDLLSRAKTLDARVSVYYGLRQLTIDYRSIGVIAFDQASAQEHQRLRRAYPRLGNMDLKIAAMALVNQAILLTRNQADFGQIAELQIEDWSRDT